MITAKEALELVEQSEMAMTRRMNQIGERIRETAMLGKRELWMTSAVPYQKEFEVEENPYQTPVLTPLQRLIEKELSKLGYSMKIVQREVTIGGGLGSIEEPRQEMRPYIRISW
jgi:hypothetical protein